MMPAIPALVGTRLRLELLLQDSFIDLEAVSEVILSDAGATLQILRLIGEEFAEDEDRPTRIQDCIASLSIDRCYATVCNSAVSRESAVVKHWQHSRRVAQYAKELAGCVHGVSPDEAYMVGLLYGLGEIPGLLGWSKRACASAEPALLGVTLAHQWNLPACVIAAIREQRESVDRPQWIELLQVAELAVQRASADTFRADA